MIRLYVPSPRPILPIRNTDWVYPRHLSNLARYNDRFEINFPEDTLFDVWNHTRFVSNVLRHRMSIPVPHSWTYRLSEYFSLPFKDRHERRCDAIFAYERYPRNANKPVIWMTGATDIPKLRARGWSEDVIQRELDFKREASERAAMILFLTDALRREFVERNQPSKPTGVMRYLILFEAAKWAQVMAKWEAPDPIRLLFVGRAANRKGLPLVLAAYQQLRQRLGNRILLHVVTEESDGPIQFPSIAGITRDLRSTRSQTAELMRCAHFLVMPSNEENYGIVYIEAMASGAIPLATDMANQRELLHEGRAGLLVKRNVDAIVSSIFSCIEETGKAAQLVRYGRRLWETEYQPSVVSNELYNMAARITSSTPQSSFDSAALSTAL